MIDTVVLRLHGLKKYAQLVTRLQLKKNEGYRKQTTWVEKAEADRLLNAGYPVEEVLQILKINGNSRSIVKTEVYKQVNASHHYMFSYWKSISEDFIEFNFSVPKYKYGTNVLQYVEHSVNRDFKLTSNWTMEYNLERAPARAMAFIQRVLQREFIEDHINLSDIEVTRIDVCFNQVFKSKDEALTFLNFQKKLRKKHAREDGSGKVDYDTSFMYATKRFSSKVYHKGTEYSKHDLKEHQKINEAKGYQYFNTGKLQAFADLMLRYELTIRSPEINYLFKHNLFREKCPFFKINFRNYQRIAATKQRNQRIAKKIGSLPEEEQKIYRKYHPYEHISKEDNYTYKYVSNLIETKPMFMLEIDESDSLYNKKEVNYKSYKALFSKSIIELCLKKLMNFIKDFQIKELPDEEKVGLLIDQYNRLNKSKLQKAELIRFYLLIVKHGSFKEAALESRYSRATLYRYKDRLKKIGITEKNIKPGKNYKIPQAAIDFREYHAYLDSKTLIKK